MGPVTAIHVDDEIAVRWPATADTEDPLAVTEVETSYSSLGSRRFTALRRLW